MGLVLDTNVFIQTERRGALDFSPWTSYGDAHISVVTVSALSHGCALVTANMDEFQRVPGLEVLALPEA